jgi:hypothetical protein
MDVEIRQLDAIREAAFGLAMEFAQAARAEGDVDRKLQLFDAFHRGSASVRLSIALAMRLRREGRRPAAAQADARERPDAGERPDTGERHDERDRDRETERVSLPILLRTLERVADDAGALLPQAAELPSLREILDRVRAQPAAAPPAPATVPLRPPSQSPLRARLSGGTAALTLAPPPGPGLPGPGLPGPGLPGPRSPGLPGASPRRSTGPPTR